MAQRLRNTANDFLESRGKTVLLAVVFTALLHTAVLAQQAPGATEAQRKLQRDPSRAEELFARPEGAPPLSGPSDHPPAGAAPYKAKATPSPQIVGVSARVQTAQPIGRRELPGGGFVYYFALRNWRVIPVRVHRLDSGVWIAERDTPAGPAVFVIYQP